MRGVAALLVALAAAPALAEVRSDVRYRLYPVHGGSLAEVWRDIGRQGPHQRHRGLYAQALAEIRYGWNIAYRREGRTCRVGGATVTVKVTIVLPDWAEKARAAAPLQAAWRRYIAAVRAHEEAHLAMALRTAAALDRLAGTAPPAGDCRRLERNLGRRAAALLAEERRRQEAFDRHEREIRLGS